MGIILPFAVLSLMAGAILLIWMRYGAGVRTTRCLIAAVVLSILTGSWVVLLSEIASATGVHAAIVVGIVTCIFSLWIPSLWKNTIMPYVQKVASRKNFSKKKADQDERTSKRRIH